MLFNSPEFIVFCAIVYGLYVTLPFRLQNHMLLLASYIFYGWWDVRFLFLVVLSTTVDFWVGLMIDSGRLERREWLLPGCFLVGSAGAFLGLDTRMNLASLVWCVPATIAFLALVLSLFRIFTRFDEHRRRLNCLMVSLVTQLGLLGIFKYFNFFAESLANVLKAFGINEHALHLNIVLPVGVSFYTFQSLSYTIDIYRKQFKPTRRFLDFALFVAYFPQLQAGPIERARQLLPQLANPRRIQLDQISQGVYLVLFGFFKKIAIADGFSPIVDRIFNTPGHVTWIDVVAGTAFFTVQIYCDFSGYTDIARGISKFFGIELVLNFNQPYFAANPQEFWRRWHISLSTWLRDYLYIPLGGNKGGTWFICRNLMITMLIGGLWHGAAWNFVLWGFYQGLALCIYRLWIEFWIKPAERATASHTTFVDRLVAHAAFIIFLCYGWLLFRARSMAQIVEFSKLLVTDFGNLDYGAGPPRLSAILGIILLIILEIAQYRSATPTYYQRLPVPLRGLLVATILSVILMGMSNEPAQFIYFQF